QRRTGPRERRGRRADRRPVRGGSGRRGPVGGRLRERAGGGPRLRPHRRRVRRQLTGTTYAVRRESPGSGEEAIFDTHIATSSTSSSDPTGGGSPSRSCSS